MADTKWKETAGVSDHHARVTIVCHEDDAETWMEEADENGYPNRSRYLYELTQEARAYRDEGFLDPTEDGRVYLASEDLDMSVQGRDCP